jgi:hypothetical protein
MKSDFLLGLTAALRGSRGERVEGGHERLLRRARRAILGFRPEQRKFPGLSGNSHQRRVARRAAGKEIA